MFRNHHKTAQFTIFEDWVSFGNYMTVFYHNLLYKGIDGELKLIPGWNSSQNTTTIKSLD